MVILGYNRGMNKTLFFYDLETSGLRPREDRIMQFAGQRTDMNLNPIGEPVNILVKMTNDALPSPGAINVTGITPQATLMDGVSEAEFCRYVTEEVFTPETVAVGYNTVRFDDEFMRACLWRNFYDSYEWEWKDGRSRWDMLDVVRLTRALRPEGIEWPFTPEGKPTNRLELLTKLNGVEHEHAHDALSDVYATIAVARLIRDKQPKLFDYLYRMRGKREVQKLVNLENPQPFVYASGRYANEFNKTTVAVPIAPGRNGNVLVYDLRYNLEELNKQSSSTFSSAGLEDSGTSYTGQPAEPPASQANLSVSSGIYVPEFSNQNLMPQKEQFLNPLLLRAVDENKDQTYFLYRISEEALAHTVFPIGGMLKPEVKKLAKERVLHNAYKKESMGVCFVGEVGMRDFLKEYIDTQPGEIREIESDRVLGYHEGAVFYTIGQRHGLYISGGLPYYVVKKDIKQNIVYVSKNLNDENLWTNELRLRDIFLRQFDGSFLRDGVAFTRRHGESAPHTSVVTSGSPSGYYC